jgi:hypothetical protein
MRPAMLYRRQIRRLQAEDEVSWADGLTAVVPLWSLLD